MTSSKTGEGGGGPGDGGPAAPTLGSGRFESTDGSAYHQFNPLTMIAGRGDSMEYEDRPHWYSDDALWMVLAVSAYLKETGDYAFLQKTIPFYEKDKAEKPLESGTVLEHLLRAVAFTHDHTCLLYTSDAADDLLCVDLGGRRIIKKNKTHKPYNPSYSTLSTNH